MRCIKLISVAFLILCSSCIKQGANLDPSALVIALASEPKTLDPRYATDAYGMRISELIFSTFVQVGANLEVVGNAAKSWDYHSLKYVFDLHPGLKFSNGRAVTSEDLIFTFEEFQKPSNPFASTLTVISKVTARNVGDHLRLEIQLKNFKANFLSADLPSVKILPKMELLEVGDGFSRQLIGSGPYRLLAQNQGEIVLQAIMDHPYLRSRTEKLVFKIIRDDMTRYQKVLRGEVDIAQNELPPIKIKQLEKRKNQFLLLRSPGLSMNYLLINFQDRDLKNKVLRQALSRAINRKDVIDFKLEGFGREATSLLTPSNPHFAASLKNLPFDLAKARQIIKALNIQDRKFILKTSDNPAAIDNGRVLAHQLQQAGLQVQVQSYEWGTFYGDVKAGNFEIATMKWVGVIDPDIYRSAFHSSEWPPGRNRGRYSNPALDQLLDQGMKIPEYRRRLEHYYKVQEMVLEDLPIIPLWYDEQIVVAQKSIAGLLPSKTGDYLSFINIEKKTINQ